jgi:hypothetical protein
VLDAELINGDEVGSIVECAKITPEQTQEIIRHSAEATHADWERAPDFDFCEVDTTKTGSRTSAVLMIAGSPYYRPVQENDEDLSPHHLPRDVLRTPVCWQRGSGGGYVLDEVLLLFLRFGADGKSVQNACA